MALRHRIRPLRARLLLLLAVLGPGIITANVDNDAGGITTYSVAGAHYGYSLLWIMPLVALALIIVQEMSARLGVVTGKGLADLIRESLGVRLTAIIIGIDVDRQSRQHRQRVCGRGRQHGNLRRQQIHLGARWSRSWCGCSSSRAITDVSSASFWSPARSILTYVHLRHAGPTPMARSRVSALSRPPFRLDAGYVTIVVTIIGTTIAPWMQFYQQASIVDKGLKVTDYAYERLDVIVGSLFAVVVASFIMIACAATLYREQCST